MSTTSAQPRLIDLVTQLNQDESWRFYQALVRQSMTCVQYAVELRSEAAQVQFFLTGPANWLNTTIFHPSPPWEKDLLIMNLVSEEFAERRRHVSLVTMSNWFDLILLYLCDVLQLSDDLTQASKEATQLAFVVPMVRHKKGMGKLYAECRSLSQATEQWHRDAALAILQGSEPPPFSMPAETASPH